MKRGGTRGEGEEDDGEEEDEREREGEGERERGGEGEGEGEGEKVVMKKGPWSSSEDTVLVEYVKKHGEGNWNAVYLRTGMRRCGKSCRLRWANHLRPNLKKGPITPLEERAILSFHAQFGNKWAKMAQLIPGRTDNEIKNFWNTRCKRLSRQRASTQNAVRSSPSLTTASELFFNVPSPFSQEISSGDALLPWLQELPSYQIDMPTSGRNLTPSPGQVAISSSSSSPSSSSSLLFDESETHQTPSNGDRRGFFDPLAFLGGRALTLFDQETEENTCSPLFELWPESNSVEDGCMRSSYNPMAIPIPPCVSTEKSYDGKMAMPMPMSYYYAFEEEGRGLPDTCFF